LGPDPRDVQTAEDFGRSLRQPLQAAGSLQDLAPPEFPGNRPYREFPDAAPAAPDTDPERCLLCGDCAELCPTGAVSLGETSAQTDPGACIWCCACVKACPEGARSFDAEPVTRLRDWLAREYAARQEPTLMTP
jgi:ferredoxin